MQGPHKLNDIGSTAGELKSPSSPSGNEGSKDWLRRTKDGQGQSKESQEVVPSASTQSQADVLRNIAVHSDSREGDPVHASSSTPDHAAPHFEQGQLREELDDSYSHKGIPMETLRPRDSMSSDGRSHNEGEERTFLSSNDRRRDDEERTLLSSNDRRRGNEEEGRGNEEDRLLSRRDLQRFREDLEMGMMARMERELDRRDAMRDTNTQNIVQQELANRDKVRDNRKPTWKEWFNSDWNSYVSTAGVAGIVIGAAAFVYTYRPDLIPHH